MAESYRSFTDPVHGIVKFDKRDPLEGLLLEMIDTPSFQRLRRISQLGITSFTYPSGTHTRFAHSIGTFAVAREMCDIVKRQGFEDKDERDATLAAALLHDVGHGPYSHIFERALAKVSGKKKPHEQWSAEIITQSADIAPLLEAHRPGFASDVAGYVTMQRRERGLYPSIISGAFDADRIDYMMRDRLMCGITGSIVSKEWIMNSLEVFEGQDAGNPRRFGISVKGLPAVEEYLVARMDLYAQIYFHKHEKAREISMGALLEKAVEKPELLDDKYSPIEKMLKGDMSLETYCRAADADMECFVARMADSPDREIAALARDYARRDAYKCREFAAMENAETFARANPGSHVADILIRAYDPQGKENPIYVVDRRDAGADGRPKIRELSEVSDVASRSRRLIRVYTYNPRKDPREEAVNWNPVAEDAIPLLWRGGRE